MFGQLPFCVLPTLSGTAAYRLTRAGPREHCKGRRNSHKVTESTMHRQVALGSRWVIVNSVVNQRVVRWSLAAGTWSGSDDGLPWSNPRAAPAPTAAASIRKPVDHSATKPSAIKLRVSRTDATLSLMPRAYTPGGWWLTRQTSDSYVRS